MKLWRVHCSVHESDLNSPSSSVVDVLISVVSDRRQLQQASNILAGIAIALIDLQDAIIRRASSLRLTMSATATATDVNHQHNNIARSCIILGLTHIADHLANCRITSRSIRLIDTAVLSARRRVCVSAAAAAAAAGVYLLWMIAVHLPCCSLLIASDLEVSQ